MKHRKYLYGSLGLLSLLGFIDVYKRQVITYFSEKSSRVKAAGRVGKLRRKCSIIEFSLSPMTRSNILKMMKR